MGDLIAELAEYLAKHSKGEETQMQNLGFMIDFQFQQVAQLKEQVAQLTNHVAQLNNHGHTPFSKTHAGFGSAILEVKKCKD